MAVADDTGSADKTRDEFVPAAGTPNPLAVGQPGAVEDMVWFGLVPGLIINKLRQRKASKDHAARPLERLEDLSFRELADLEEGLADILDGLEPPEDADPDFCDGYDCHVRLMRWMTQEGKRGDAIRHALDARDGETLMQFLTDEHQVRATEPEFFLGFQAANGELASEFESRLPRD